MDTPTFNKLEHSNNKPFDAKTTDVKQKQLHNILYICITSFFMIVFCDLATWAFSFVQRID